MTRSLDLVKRGVDLTGLVVDLQGTRILDGVTIQVAPGEILALLGPSGCGKTTMLRAIAGLQAPSAGSIIIGDVDMTDVPPYRRNVGMVFQNYALFPHMTVTENIAFGLKMRKTPEAERAAVIEATLEMLELSPLRDSYPARLSGGQQQRVALARTIATQPAVLLLDEPLSALDKRLKEEMRVELRALLKKVGITAIIVTHDQEEALAIADRIAVMNRGRIAQIGSGLELYHQPNSRFVADFIGHMNYFDGVLKSRAGGMIDVAIAGEATLSARDGGALRIGDPVTLAVRPEAIAFRQQARSSADERVNTRAARLESVEFLGAITYMRFRDQQERELLTIAGGARPEPSTLGQWYELAWPVESTSVIAADAETALEADARARQVE